MGLRLGRWGIAGFSMIAFVSTFVQTTGFYQIAGHTPADRAALGASMSALAAQFVALFPPPIRPDTVGGYVEFRANGAAPGEVARHDFHTAQGWQPAARRDVSWLDFPPAVLTLNFRLMTRF